ncbi:hypothetical protein HY967_02330 [Candidatus Jorgensenbacteria bacterium]|nr:hypothetical protein [Candidatus Jorgensenbacteria bacterium]
MRRSKLKPKKPHRTWVEWDLERKLKKLEQMRKVLRALPKILKGVRKELEHKEKRKKKSR